MLFLLPFILFEGLDEQISSQITINHSIRICSENDTQWLHFQVEALILEKVQDLPKGIERENRIIQTIMRQLLFALDSLHSTGIVHRDIKPQNIIFSEGNSTSSHQLKMYSLVVYFYVYE